MTTARLAFWGTVLIAVGQVLYYTPKLPVRVASHFGGDGVADGWQSPSGFMTFDLLMIGIMAGSFGLLPALMRRFPASMINVPNRDYWLTPERRTETLATLERSMLWIGTLTMVFLILVMHMVIAANLNPPPVLGGGFMPLLIGYLALIAVACFGLVRRFRLPTPTSWT